jgi:hypothetical protein
VTVRPDRPTIIVVTPVRDEAWILDTFLATTTAWADHVIIADQQSTDGSPQIAARYDRVRVIRNDNPVYDEGHRQRLLLDEARKIPGPRIIFALDADEILSGNALDGDFFDRVRSLPPGGGVRMRWAQLLPGLRQAWVAESDWKYFGFIDNGAEHGGQQLHSGRLPVAESVSSLTCEDVFVLHLNYAAWERSWSKLRWYQCWEALENPHSRPIGIYRQYHHIDAIPPDQIRDADEGWTAAYSRCGIELRVSDTDATRFDEEVLDWILRFGAERFGKIDIWQGVDWRAKAQAVGREVPAAAVADPRSATERIVMRWLARTQPHAAQLRTRTVQWLLRPAGW